MRLAFAIIVASIAARGAFLQVAPGTELPHLPIIDKGIDVAMFGVLLWLVKQEREERRFLSDKLITVVEKNTEALTAVDHALEKIPNPTH
jgi:hypothetical protein